MNKLTQDAWIKSWECILIDNIVFQCPNCSRIFIIPKEQMNEELECINCHKANLKIKTQD